MLLPARLLLLFYKASESIFVFSIMARREVGKTRRGAEVAVVQAPRIS